MKLVKLEIKSINNNLLKSYVNYLQRHGAVKYTILSLPAKKKRISLLRSPHVYKKAWEHFDLVIYKRILSFKLNDVNFVKFIFMSKPKGVKLSLKYYN